MKYLFTICFCILTFQLAEAQVTEAQKIADEKKLKEQMSQRMDDEDIKMFKQHQIYLDKPAMSIEQLEYDKDQTPIKGKLSEDGMRIIMDGYTKKGRVKAVVMYADGERAEFTKSTCFIDPVIEL